MIPVLAARNLTKRFSGVTALSNVSFDLHDGEIHALCGENGAGKSTLIKLLGGIYPCGSYEGDLLLSGQPAQFSSPSDAERSGIAVIHQELALVSELSAAENLFLGRLPVRAMRVEWTRVFKEAAHWFEKVGLFVDPQTPVAELGIAQRQLLEIARALSKQTRILILDEPTAALSEHETQTLLRLLQELRTKGVSAIYISHRLEEVFSIADRISVLRDGQSVFSAPTWQTDRKALVRHMANREVSEPVPRSNNEAGFTRAQNAMPLLRVNNLYVRDSHSARDDVPFLQDISMDVFAGEIVGIGGLMGAGRTSLLQHLAGCWGKRVQGSVELGGTPLACNTPEEAMSLGIALVSEDRRRHGVIQGQNISFNLSLSSLPSITRSGIIRQDLEIPRNRSMFERLGIRAPGLETTTSVLSGGNQQKNVLGRVLLTEPRLILLDEPTRGIDVGAKEEIYAIIRSLAQAGTGVVLVSSELPELMALSDRILMLREGRINGSFTTGTSPEQLLAAAMGQNPA